MLWCGSYRAEPLTLFFDLVITWIDRFAIETGIRFHGGLRTIDCISGGQQQRAALARAQALEPKVLLLDEPLSNLDANLRVVTREEIRNIQERIGIATIFVTHDQYEAMSISDRLLVLHGGVIQQIGSPVDIYERSNTFHGAVESQMYAGNLARYAVKFGDRLMVDDHYNPMGSEKFVKNDRVKVTVPRAIHVLRR